MTKYATVQEVGESPDYPFKISQLRYLIACRQENGFDRVLHRPSPRRWLINLEAFDQWLDESRVAQNA